MNASTLTRVLAIGTITGMRSMAGIATFVAPRSGLVRNAAVLLAASEMAADKTAAVGDRTDPLPLAGRAVMGAVAGGLVARQEHQGIVLGALVGASVAVVAAHLAYHLRKRLAGSTIAGGLIEDAIVVGAGALFVGNARR
jgi:uncharacterized membrane protein